MTLPWKSNPRKRVLKELKRLRRIYEPDLDAQRREGKATTDAYKKLVGEYLVMRGPFDEELWTIESHDLRLRALQWAVVVPPVHEWNQGIYRYQHLDEATRARSPFQSTDEHEEGPRRGVGEKAIIAAGGKGSQGKGNPFPRAGGTGLAGARVAEGAGGLAHRPVSGSMQLSPWNSRFPIRNEHERPGPQAALAASPRITRKSSSRAWLSRRAASLSLYW